LRRVPYSTTPAGCAGAGTNPKEAIMDAKLLKQGMFSWSELITTDVEGAKKFYGSLLGWKSEDMPKMNYTVVSVGEDMIGGVMKLTKEMKGVPPHWGVYITVDDVDASAKKAEKLGGKLLVPPTDIPEVGRFSVIQDPQGAVFSIIKYVPKP
jgi:uncharacterized protein